MRLIACQKVLAQGWRWVEAATFINIHNALLRDPPYSPLLCHLATSLFPVFNINYVHGSVLVKMWILSVSTLKF